MANKVKANYEDKQVVIDYTRAAGLQLPERTIFASLEQQLPLMRMLDIGVGGGRTTAQLARFAREYVGIDYSAPMIEACRSRFRGTLPNARFEVCDATDMRRFGDKSFDLVLFSFNGIDCVSHEDRLEVLAEVHRVGRPGGIFCFSTHNLQTNRFNALRDHIERNPIRTLSRVAGWLRWRIRHQRAWGGGKLRSASHAVISDGAQEGGLDNYYIKPSEQLAQIEPWFADARVYSLRSGQELRGEDELARAKDPWLYYLCYVR